MALELRAGQEAGQRSREAVRRLHADHPHRVFQRPRQQGREPAGFGAAQAGDGAAADDRFIVDQGRLQCAVAFRSRVVFQQGQGRGAHQHGVEVVGRQRAEFVGGAGVGAAPARDDLTVMRRAPGAVPLDHLGLRPRGVLVDVAAQAGVRRADRRRKRRVGYAKAVVGTVVVAHVRAPGHVAFAAQRAAADLEQHFAVRPDDRFAVLPGLLVEMVLVDVVLRLAVTLQAQRVVFQHGFHRVHVVAVAAAHVALVHLALRERAVNVDLVEDLAVGEVQALVEQARQEGVHEGAAVVVEIAHRGAPRVARRAQLDVLARAQAGGGLHQPEIGGRRTRDVGDLGPLDVQRTRSVAGFAADVDVRPGGRVAVGLRIVVLVEVGRVALRAHAVPVLRRVGPVKPVVRVDVLDRGDAEPAVLARVPGDRQGLQAPARERHEVLLQREPAEGVGDLELAHLAARPVGVDEIAPVAAVETGGHAEQRELGVVEIAEHGFGTGDVHRQVVVRPGPALELGLVAVLAALAADKGGRRRQGRGRVRLRRAREPVDRQRDHQQGRGRQRQPFPGGSPFGDAAHVCPG